MVGGLSRPGWSRPCRRTIVGASGLVFGWLGYLLARAYFSRRICCGSSWPRSSVFFFGALLGGLLPTVNSDVSWQAHACGFVAGILAGWVLHPREAAPARPAAPAGR